MNTVAHQAKGGDQVKDDGGAGKEWLHRYERRIYGEIEKNETGKQVW